MNRSLKKWTPETDAELIRLWKEGLTVKEICQRTGRSPGVIWERRVALKLSARTVANGWPPEHDALIVKLWTEGKSCSEIASALGETFDVIRSRNAVIGRLHRKGLSRAQQGPKEKRLYHYRPRPVRKPKPATKRIPSLGKAPAVTGIDYRRIPGTEETAAQCAAYGRDRVAWVEAGAGVVSLNARPFFEGSGCKWPLADGMRCCNSIARGQYCAGHASVAYERATKGPSAAILTRHDGVLDKYRAAGPESTAWDNARLAA